jgi:hypothetical protein
MPHTPAPPSDAATLARLAILLRDGNVDAAIESGLMEVDAGAAGGDLPAGDRELVASTQARLRTAWQARERYRARRMRLARIAAERETRRAGAAPAPTSKAPLPPAAAAALARALAKASERNRP